MKFKKCWTNWMAMYGSLDDAKCFWPKAEWEDIKCYIDYGAYRIAVEALKEAAEVIHDEFCSRQHHSFCIKAREALKKLGEE